MTKYYTYQNEKLTLPAVAEKLGVHVTTLRARMRKGMSPRAAFAARTRRPPDQALVRELANMEELLSLFDQEARNRRALRNRLLARIGRLRAKMGAAK